MNLEAYTNHTYKFKKHGQQSVQSERVPLKASYTMSRAPGTLEPTRQPERRRMTRKAERTSADKEEQISSLFQPYVREPFLFTPYTPATMKEMDKVMPSSEIGSRRNSSPEEKSRLY